MKNEQVKQGRIPVMIHYAMIGWTIICFLGTWFIILKYGIFLDGLIAIVLILFFAIWIIPLIVLSLVSLYVTPSEESPPYVTFKDLIRKGIKRVPE